MKLNKEICQRCRNGNAHWAIKWGAENRILGGTDYTDDQLWDDKGVVWCYRPPGNRHRRLWEWQPISTNAWPPENCRFAVEHIALCCAEGHAAKESPGKET